MRCPFCSSSISKVLDKRSVAGSGEIRRRRECLKCFRRFTTYERIGRLEIVVIKNDGRKEAFNREKIRAGIAKALEKRPGIERMDDLVERVERKLRRRNSLEVSSKIIGVAVLSELKTLDRVAYLRFASVYRRFDNPNDFAKEIISLAD